MQGHNILPRRYVGGGIAARFIIFQPTYYKKRYVEDLIGASVVNESLRIKIQSTIKRHVYKAAFARRGKLLGGKFEKRRSKSRLETRHVCYYYYFNTVIVEPDFHWSGIDRNSSIAG